MDDLYVLHYFFVKKETAMAKSRFELDMSQGPILSNILRFAIPLMLANVLQLLYNAADLIVVSRWSGSEAMASVGTTGALTNLLINVFVGMSLGASVVVSRNFGAQNNEGIYKSVHTSMLLGIIAGGCALVIGQVFCKPLLLLMDTPEGPVLDGAILYMRIIFIGTPASLVYNFGAAILRAVGDTKRPLYILAISGLVNVVLNLFLVICFDMGVAGVAIATATSNYISMFMVIYALAGADSVYKLYLKELKLHKAEVKEILRIGVPAGLQGSVFSLSNTVIQSAVNSFGAAAMAGAAAAGNVEGFVYTAMNSFYQATVTSVSQNYGAKKEKRIYKTMGISALSVAIVGLVLGVTSVIFARPILSIYIKEDEAAMSFAVIRMMITGLPYFLCGIMEVLTGTIRGLGYSTITAINSLVGACGFRMIWVFAVLPFNRTPEVLFWCWPLSWIVVITFHLIAFLILRKRAMKKMYETE